MNYVWLVEYMVFENGWWLFDTLYSTRKLARGQVKKYKGDGFRYRITQHAVWEFV